ncbi:MAG: hypothetical protein Q7S46_01050 [Gallionella sp.]|nr:hypothetical protein [Gallionella sp.]
MVNPDCHINKIIFITNWPVTLSEEKRWNFKYLRSQGLEVEVFDLTTLLDHEYSLKHPMSCDTLQGDFVRRISSYRELDSLLDQSATHSIFVDGIAGYSDVPLKLEKIFRLLKRHNARYIISSITPYPSPSLLNDQQGRIKLMLFNLRKISNPWKVLVYIARKLILWMTRHNVIYPLPFMIFGVPAEKLLQFVAKRNISREKITPVHSSDHDTYLLYHRELKGKDTPIEDVCVFLDEAATHHPDFTLSDGEPIPAQQYFASMNRFFDFIEKTTGLSVIIAAHPNSNYESMPGVFGGRPIIKGKTAEMVAKSRLVVTHMSASVSFAVLFQKPLMLVKTADMRLNPTYHVMTDVLATALDIKPIDIDEGALPPSSIPKDFNHEKYEEYLYKYVKSRGVDDRLVWEIIVSEIKKAEIGTE